MLTDELWLFVPALFVAPVVLVALYFRRRSGRAYIETWLFSVTVTALLSGVICNQYLSIPLPSEQDITVSNPGGWSFGGSDIVAALCVLSVVVFLQIPAYPVLAGLAFLSPLEWKTKARLLIAGFLLLYLTVLAGLVIERELDRKADLQQLNAQPLRK